MAVSPPSSPSLRETRDIPRSFFLELPTELRLQIYDYALAESESVTITSATVLDEQGANLNNITSFSSISDLPNDHIPLIKTLHDPSLLSITAPPTLRSPASSFASAASSSTTSLDSDVSESTADTDPTIFADSCHSVSAPISLRQTCRFINDELTSHLSHHFTTKSTLHINYPYGLLVLKDRCPHLLRQAKQVYVYGAYTADDAVVLRSTPQATREYRSWFRRREPPTLPKVPKFVTEAATSTLASLVRTVLSPDAHPTLEKLEMRIFYPNEDAYSQVWTDDNSPIVVALQNTCGGKIDMVCWRGRKGTGLHLVTKPNPNYRIVSTVWKRMGDWGSEARAEEDCEKWVIGETEGMDGGRN